MPADFLKLMSARFFFNFAVKMLAVVAGWQMYMITRDPLHLGFLGLAEAIPAIGIALYAGWVVDRSRPLVVYQGVLLGSLVSGLVIWYSQRESAAIPNDTRVLALYLASFVGGCARGFSQPSMFAIVPRIVPRGELARASAYTSSAMQLATILGPALGGVFYGWLGVSFPASFACAMLVVAILSTLLIRTRVPAPERVGKGPVAEELLSGLRFVFGHGILLPALTLDMLSVFFGGVTALLPIFAAEVLFTDSRGLGLLRAAPAIGAGLMSFGLTRLDYRERAGKWLLASVTGFGLCILAFALSRNLWLSIGALALSGAFDSVSMIVRGTAVQFASPDAMRGRISSVNSIFIGSSNELGEFESGLAAHLLGTVPAVLFGGFMCLATVAGVAVLAPGLRGLNLKHLEEQKA